MGMTQTKVGESIGVSFQQMQKYERGANRISSSRLYDLSGMLEVPIEYFFGDMPTAVAASSPTLKGGRAKEPPSYEPDPMHKQETLELVRAYYKIEDTNVRDRLRELTKAIGTGASKDS